jgi:hypothetical protein
LNHDGFEKRSLPVERRVQADDEPARSGVLAWAVNVAWHARLATIVTEPSEQSASPDHPPNVEPAVGVAVNLTVVRAGYIPAALTVPVPVWGPGRIQRPISRPMSI